MNQLHATLLASACALALAACGGGESQQAPETTGTPTTPPATDTTAPAGTPAATDPTVDAMTPPAGDTATGTATGTPGGTGTDAATGGTQAAGQGDTAAVTGCATGIEGNDRMQFNVNSIVVPSSCAEFTINLRHTGQLPEAAMGHNVVITSAADMAAVAADGIAAGAASDYVKSDDDRVIAATEMIGGGETTSVTFSVDRIRDGSFQFFCSFPGHAALMKGTISVQ